MSARRSRRSRASPILRLVSWNIHKGIGGVDRRYRPERVVEVLRRLHGDFVFLQEVDEGVPRSHGHRQVDLLGDALGYPYRSFGPNVRLKRGHYGNAILSRYPFDHRENIDLTIPLKKRRGALHTRLTLDLAGKHLRLWLFNVHLGLSGVERGLQVRRLLRFVARHRAPRRSTILLGGDFNDVFNRVGALLEPSGFTGVARPPATFPAIRPLRSLDRVYARGPLSIRSLGASHSELARQASDHLPVVCVVQ